MNLGSLTETVAAASGGMIDGVSIGSWDDRLTWRIDFKPDATEEQRDAARSALLSWREPPPKDPPLAFYDFVALFTEANRQAILAAALAGNRDVLEVLFLAAGNAHGIDLADPRVILGVGVLEAAGCITAEEKTRVLAGQRPE